ncbi:MAG: M1 family aminopeptidase [Sandaracinaceae bacterium]
MTRARDLLLVVLAVGLTACGGATVTEGADTTRRPEEPTEQSHDTGPPGARLASDVVPTRYILNLAVDPRGERFTGVIEIDVRLPHRRQDIYLHGRGLHVAEVSVADAGRDPTPAEWSMVEGREEEGLAHVRAARPVGPGTVRLRVTYSAPFDQQLEGFYRVEHAGHHYVYSQMEPLGARRAFPCFDEPSFKTPFDVTLVVREDDRAIANAREVDSASISGNMRRVRFATTEPIPTYLFALAVGPFDVVDGPPIPPTDSRSAPLALRGVAPAGEGAQLAYAMEHTGAIVRALEDYFGVGYPYDKLDLIAVPDFGAGAMENPGAITFRSRLLLLAEDAPLAQRRAYAFVTAHELAHHWFGDLVTMAWWDDLWLNEAFATWMETSIVDATFPEYAADLEEMDTAIHAMRADSLASARQIRQPIESDHDIMNAFDAITYSKGQAVLSMFERYLGHDVFQAGVRRYVREHAEHNATADDLLSALSEAAGSDVAAPFRTFLEQPGVPLVEVTPSCADGTTTLAMRQSRYVPAGSRASTDARWSVPVCVRYSAGGELRRACTLLTETEGSMELEGGCADWVLPNADGIGYYVWTLPPDALSALSRRGLSQLTVREAMGYANNVVLSFNAGRSSYADAFTALRPLTSRSERQLATAPMGLIRFGLEHGFTDDARRETAERSAARLYRNAERQLGWRARRGEDTQRTLMRVEIADFLTQAAHDRQARNAGADLGRAFLGVRTDGTIHADAVDSDLVPLVVQLAVQDSGPPVFERALAYLDGTGLDPQTRGAVLGAASSTRDPELRTRMLDRTLTDRVPVGEIFQVLRSATQEPAGAEATYAWLTQHYDALVARAGPMFAGYLPYVASSFCTAERATEVRTFFAPRMGATLGGPRNLESVVEGIELCAARAEHARQTIDTVLR